MKSQRDEMPSKRRRTLGYIVVDVFTEAALEGNPLAVFPDAVGLEKATMQRIARELNLSETVFGLPSRRRGCSWRLRIFTPAREMAFAGHPTLGAAFVLRKEGIVGDGAFCLELPIGPVPLRFEGSHRPLVWLKTPEIRRGRTFERGLCASALGLRRSDLLEAAPRLLSAGNPTIFVPVRTLEAVDRAWLDVRGWERIKGSLNAPACVYVFAPRPGGAYGRMFAPEYGIVEDPATGSSAGPLALFLQDHGFAPAADETRLVLEQGTKMGRRSFLHVILRGKGGSGGIEVGGHVTPVAKARMSL